MQKKWIISLSALALSLPAVAEEPGISAQRAEPQPNVRAQTSDTIPSVLGKDTAHIQDSFQEAQKSIGDLRREMQVKGKNKEPSRKKISELSQKLNAEVDHAEVHGQALVNAAKPYPEARTLESFNGIKYALNQAQVMNDSVQARIDRGEFVSNRAAVLSDLGQLEAILAAGVDSAQTFNQSAGISAENIKH